MPIITSPKTLNLALQGGGSHGAFTWGVLDRLLDEELLTIEGISGTSAGALNGAVYAQGFCKGGRKGAKEELENFWFGVSDIGTFGGGQNNALQQMLGNWTNGMAEAGGFSPVAMVTDFWQRVFSPYQSNPFNYNPLRELIAKMVDLDAIHKNGTIKLFVCATSVETGHPRIFSDKDLSIDALMASACLPFTFQAVEIDKKPYWDGGYVGNPAIFPLIYGCQSPDVAIVQINPLTRLGTPDTPNEIINRLNEISFNAALIGEMRAIAFVQKLVEEDHLKSAEAARLKKMNIHVIGAEEEMRQLGASSKFDTQRSFLTKLRDIGRAATEQWLTANWASIGEKSSIDIKEMFLS